MAVSRSRKRRKRRRKPEQLELILPPQRSAAQAAPKRKLTQREVGEFQRRLITHGPRAVEKQLIRRRVKRALLPAKTGDVGRRAAILNITELGKYKRNLCGKREQRRAVLHHLGHTGSATSLKRRRRTASSGTTCIK